MSNMTEERLMMTEPVRQSAIVLTDTEWLCLATICLDDEERKPDALHLRRTLRRRIIGVVPHTYTVDAYLHAHEARPCLYCGEGRNHPLHERDGSRLMTGSHPVTPGAANVSLED